MPIKNVRSEKPLLIIHVGLKPGAGTPLGFKGVQDRKCWVQRL